MYRILETDPNILLNTLENTKIRFPVIRHWKPTLVLEMVSFTLDNIRTEVRPNDLSELGFVRRRPALQDGCRKMSQIMASLVVYCVMHPRVTPVTLNWDDIKHHEYWRRYRINSDDGNRIDTFMRYFIMGGTGPRGFRDMIGKMNKITLYEIAPEPQ